MSKKKLIDAIEVKSPCSENWAEMQGNDRVRFCSHCTKNVNNLSEMTRREAVRLVRASGGNLCIRYIKHPITHKPFFAGQLHRITRRTTGLAAGVISATIGLSSAAYAQDDSRAERAPVVVEKINIREKAVGGSERTNGVVSGTIRDSNNAPIPYAVVHIVEVTTGVGRGTAANDQGFYEIQALPPGTYKIEINGSGFITRHVTDVSVSSGDITTRDVFLDRAIAEKSSEFVTLSPSVAVEVSGGIGISLPEFEYPLSNAVQNDDLEEVKALISRGARVNAREKYSSGITPLFVAVENGNRAIAEILIRFGAKVNARNTDRRTPLMLLDDDAEDGLVELLVQNGAKLDLVDKDGNPALILAAEEAEARTVKALIAAGASVNIQNNSGETALMKAADRNDLEMVRALILAGADVNLKNNDDDTAWDLATDDEVEELLESYGGEGGLPDDEPVEETGDAVPEKPLERQES